MGIPKVIPKMAGIMLHNVKKHTLSGLLAAVPLKKKPMCSWAAGLLSYYAEAMLNRQFPYFSPNFRFYATLIMFIFRAKHRYDNRFEYMIPISKWHPDIFSGWPDIMQHSRVPSECYVNMAASNHAKSLTV